MVEVRPRTDVGYILKVEHLTKQFGTVSAVTDVSLTFDAPHMIGVIGRSGAGKPNRLRILNRLHDATGGQVVHAETNALPL